MNLCANHDVYIVRFYVHMYPETSRLILKVYLFVFALFLDKQV